MIVLDTHVLIWAVQDDDKLGKMATEHIQATAMESRLLIPAICAWEVAFVEKRGKVRFPGGSLEWFRSVLGRKAFTLAPLTPEIAIASVKMKWDHGDPADRMIVATAIDHDAQLLTADEKILRYAAQGHVKAIDARH